MATISSHVLDSVSGTHAAGIRISCLRRNESGSTETIFDKIANEQGRIAETVDLQLSDTAARSDDTTESDSTIVCELVFHSADYYRASKIPNAKCQIMDTVVLRLNLPDANGQYHLPLMLSPHSYSVWWSGSDL